MQYPRYAPEHVEGAPDPIFARYPPEVQAFLHDPRLDGIRPGERRRLGPLGAPDPETRFVELYYDDFERFPRYNWVNDPGFLTRLGFGDGRGLNGLHTDHPRFVSERSLPKRRFSDFLPHDFFWFCSQRVLDILNRFDPEALDTVPVEWTFEGGARLEPPYHALDVTPVVPAVDWARSDVWVLCDHDGVDGRRLARLNRAAFRDDVLVLPFLRDNFGKSSIWLSREVVEALVQAKIRGAAFRNYSTGANGSSTSFNPDRFWKIYP